MRIALATLCLNEMEWLPKLHEQHRGWPGLCSWVFVEGCDPAYARANPSLVTAEGLSTDGTGEWLWRKSFDDPLVTYHGVGKVDGAGTDQGKCPLRQVLLDVASVHRPDWFVVLDADEFYPKEFQGEINRLLGEMDGSFQSASFRFRHPWQPPSIQDDPPFEQEVVGGFWSMPHCHFYRWRPGLRYASNHMSPETEAGWQLVRQMRRFDKVSSAPYCVHMAFASSLKSRRAKHRYYVERGEGRDDHRGWYVRSRSAWETWQPGQALPKRAQVKRWDGVVPECFRGGWR